MSRPDAQRWQAPDFDPNLAPTSAGQRIGPSVDELAQIERAAHEEGRAAGHAEGIAAGAAEVKRLQQQLSAMLRSLSAPLADLDQEVGDALGSLAVRIAGALLEEAYVAEPERLARLVRTTLDTAGLERNTLELRVHAQDLALLQPLLQDENLRLVSDPALRRGDLRVHGASMRIDASLETRLRSAYASLRVAETPDA